MNTSLKSILSAILILSLCGFANIANAKDDKPDPVGTWKCAYNIGDQKRTSMLTITKDGEAFAGTMTWPDQKETKLKDVKFKDGELTFSAERVLGENKIPVDYKFTIDGDTLKGKGAVDSGGQKTEFDIEGKRQK
jgi:hypothetical protein